jgi:hypothetical protein
MNAAWVWHRTIANNKLHPDTFRYLWNVARRLDAAHWQFDVLRAGIDTAAELESDHMACRCHIFQVLGDTEVTRTAGTPADPRWISFSGKVSRRPR